MVKSFPSLTCPHCGSALRAFGLPEAASFSQPFHLACFNDGCPYYREGWDWMREHYEVKVSYRYRVDPDTMRASPLAVWSETAFTDRVLDHEVPSAESTSSSASSTTDQGMSREYSTEPNER